MAAARHRYGALRSRGLVLNFNPTLLFNKALYRAQVSPFDATALKPDRGQAKRLFAESRAVPDPAPEV